MRLLIAGAGDLGMHVAALAQAAGHVVLALRRTAVAVEKPQVPTLAADLAVPAAWLPRLPPHDTLLWCATPDRRDEASYRHIFLDAPRKLLDAAAEAGWCWRRVVFCSSTAVYGDRPEAQDEQSPPDPPGFNGKVLLAAEQAFSARLGERVVNGRLGGIYGPGRDLLLRRLRSGVGIDRLHPRRMNRIHIEDAAAALWLLLEAECLTHRVVNVVDRHGGTEPEVLDWLAERVGLPKLPHLQSDQVTAGKCVKPAALECLGFRYAFQDYRTGYSGPASASPST